MSAGDLDPRWDGASIPSEHWHFHRRLLERYGIVMAPGEFSRMVQRIRKGSALVVESTPERGTTVGVRLSDPAERVYVLVRGDRVVTALAPSKSLKAKRRAVHRKNIAIQSETSDAIPATT